MSDEAVGRLTREQMLALKFAGIASSRGGQVRPG
jgi:hypothetical protein